MSELFSVEGSTLLWRGFPRKRSSEGQETSMLKVSVSTNAASSLGEGERAADMEGEESGKVESGKSVGWSGGGFDSL